MRDGGKGSGFGSCDGFRSTTEDGYFIPPDTVFQTLLSWSLNPRVSLDVQLGYQPLFLTFISV